MSSLRRIVWTASLGLGLGLSTLADPREAEAFCGFYVAGADAKLFNDATVVVLMRDGTRTVVSMSNAYQGPPEAFALVIPVPVVLKESEVKTLRRELFDRVDRLASPRLVEYWEQDPCTAQRPSEGTIGLGNTGLIGSGSGAGFGSLSSTVKVEAEFTVAEYDIVILSATESTGLDAWLRDNGYNIPAGAEPLLRPYVQQDMKFFVAKVDPSKVEFDEAGRTMLSPLRFDYESKEFSLPIRLGLINAPDPASGAKQDLLIHVIAPQTRYQVANYPNVTIPTNLDVTDAAKSSFGEFYVSLFDHTLERNPGAVVTEYAWVAGSCDPCPGPDAPLTDQELLELGGDVLPNWAKTLSTGIRPGPAITMKAVRVGAGLDKDIVRRIIRAHINEVRACYNQGLVRAPSLSGHAEFDFMIGPDGKVGDATVVVDASTLADPSVNGCMAKAIKRWSFPKPQTGEGVAVRYGFDLSPTGGSSSTWGWGGGAASSFVLTRLHARYDASSLAEDLVFEAAPPIVGGREFLDGEGKLEQGASEPEFGFNNFQARYAIRHAWAGAIACDNPVRGVWGGPPEPGPTTPTLARKLATTTRGASLGSFVSASAGEQLGLTTSAKPPAVELARPIERPTELASEPQASASGSGDGCACSSGGDEGGPLALTLALLVLGVARRRTGLVPNAQPQSGCPAQSEHEQPS